MSNIVLYNKQLPLQGSFNFIKVGCDQEHIELDRYLAQGSFEGYPIGYPGGFKKAETIGAIFKELAAVSHFGTFSLFAKEERLEELQVEVGAIRSKSQFPYEMHRRATVWKEGWVELKFSPLFILFPQRDPSFAKQLEEKNGEQAKLSGNPRHILAPFRPPAAARNTLRKEILDTLLENGKILQYCTSEQADLMKKCFAELKLISYEELFSDLTAATLRLKEKLGDRPYNLIFVAGKSSAWIAELALPILGRLPERYLSYHADTVGGAVHTNLPDPDSAPKDFVFFDDFAYSGDQVYGGILTSRSTLIYPKGSQFHLVVPYISERARKKWGIDEESVDAANRKTYLYQSQKKFHSIRTVAKWADFEKAYPPFREYAQMEFNLYLPAEIEDFKTLTLTEWKFADRQSLDRDLFSQLGKQHGEPVYKLPVETMQDSQEVVALVSKLWPV